MKSKRAAQKSKAARNQLLFFSIFCFGVLIHGLGFNFISWDDTGHIYLNPHLKNYELLRLWTEPYFGLYIPATYTFWTLCRALSDLLTGEAFSPWIFHFGSILLHFCNALLVYKISLKVLKGSKHAAELAIAVSVVFVLHPVQIESWAWASELKGLLSGFFILLALNRIISIKPSDFRNWGIVFFLAALAILSKPSAVVMPPLVFIVLFCFRKESLRTSLAHALPFLLLSFLGFLITQLAQQPIQGEFVAPFLWRPVLALDALGQYIRYIIWPYPILIDYSRSPSWVLINQSFYFPALTGIALLGLIIFKFFKRDNAVAGSMSLAVATLIPTFGLVSFHFQKHSGIANRYVYLALAFFSLAGALWISRKNWPQIKHLPLVCAIVLSPINLIQARHWRSTDSLFSWTLKHNGRSYTAYNQMGLKYDREGSKSKAEKNFRKALELKNNFEAANINLGYILLHQSRFREAARHYEHMIELFPEHALAHSLLGVSYASLGQNQKAETYLNRALALDSQHATVIYNLGQFYEQNREFEKAQVIYQKGRLLNHKQSIQRLMVIFQNTGQSDKARELSLEL